MYSLGIKFSGKSHKQHPTETHLYQALLFNSKTNHAISLLNKTNGIQTFKFFFNFQLKMFRKDCAKSSISMLIYKIFPFFTKTLPSLMWSPVLNSFKRSNFHKSFLNSYLYAKFQPILSSGLSSVNAIFFKWFKYKYLIYARVTACLVRTLSSCVL